MRADGTGEVASQFGLRSTGQSLVGQPLLLLILTGRLNPSTRETSTKSAPSLAPRENSATVTGPAPCMRCHINAQVKRSVREARRRTIPVVGSHSRPPLQPPSRQESGPGFALKLQSRRPYRRSSACAVWLQLKNWAYPDTTAYPVIGNGERHALMGILDPSSKVQPRFAMSETLLGGRTQLGTRGEKSHCSGL